ncbi:MAG TPA: LLM class flavin-dependent oxidoreductase [Chloroflexota bacterium]|nr:LLM class flavin-dependent oxidoreductase [Chloroflexota bacterium]
MKFAAYAMPSYQPSFGLTQGEFMRATIDHLASAEVLGCDSVWVNEHHFHQYGGLQPSVQIMLAALAQRTSHVRLGTSVVCLPLHNPIQVAEELAMVDLMSGGRVELGVGRGFVVHDYEVLGVPYQDAQQRLMDGLEVIKKAWSGERFSHDGSHYHFTDLEVWPRPEQRPHPPIWMACSGTPSSFEWAGANGYQLLTIGYIRPVAALAELTRLYRQARSAAGFGAPVIATHFHVVVAEESKEARRIAESALAEHVRLNRESRSLSKADGALGEAAAVSIEQLVDEGRLIAGDPGECARTLHWIAGQTGCSETHCLFQFGDVTFPVAQRSLELFATEVMPRLRALEAEQPVAV